MDQTLANALKEKKELEKRLAEINTFIRLYRQFANGTKGGESGPTGRDLTDAGGGVVPQPDSIGPDTGADQGSSRVPRTQLPREEMAPLIRKTLLEVGRPLTRSALLHELDKRKIMVGGTDRARNLGTLMWRLRDQFQNIEGKGYWPKGMSVPVSDEDDRERDNDMDDLR